MTMLLRSIRAYNVIQDHCKIVICHSRITLTIKHMCKVGLLLYYAGDGVGFKLLVVCPLLAANVCI